MKNITSGKINKTNTDILVKLKSGHLVIKQAKGDGIR